MRMLGVFWAAVAVAGVFALVGLLVHRPVTADSLYESVQSQVASPFPAGACQRRSGRKWRCVIADTGGSGVGAYRVQVEEGSSCWTGRSLHDAGEPMPERIDSCVRGIF